MSIIGSLEEHPRHQSMEVDRFGVGVSSPLRMKQVTEEKVGEVGRTNEDNIHLNGLEIFPNSLECVLRPISMETQAQNQSLESNPTSAIVEALSKGTQKWKRIARKQ